MGRTKLAVCAGWLWLALLHTGCGGTDEAHSAGPPATAGDGATAEGATSGSGSGGAATAGHSSGGAATSGGSANDAAGSGATLSAAGGPPNVFVDELRGREGCLPRSLPTAAGADDGLEVGQVRCAIGFTTFPAEGCACDAAQNLRPASVTFAAAIASNAQANGSCGGATSVDCSRLCACELVQCSGAALTQCQNDATPIAQLPPGFCYVDALAVPPLGDPALVATCPSDWRRELRILGPSPAQPAPRMFIGCW